MAWGSLLKATIDSVGSAVQEAVRTTEEGQFCPITRDLVLVRPPTGVPLLSSLGRSPEWVHTRIKRDYGGYSCLLVDLMGTAEGLAALHEGPVACFDCKSATPSLQVLWSCVAALTDHLARPNSRVLVLLDEHGEGRAALCVTAFMLYTSLFTEERTALQFYRAKRPDTCLTPSQLRYLSYFVRGLTARQVFSPPPPTPVLVRLITLRNVPAGILARPKVVLEIEHVRGSYADGNAFSNRARVVCTPVFTSGEAGISTAAASAGCEGSGGTGGVSMQVAVGTHVEDDFCVTLWSVNEFRRREEHFRLQLHSSHLFAPGAQNGAVLTFPAAQCECLAGLGEEFSLELDVVRQRRQEPTTTDDGSIVIVHRVPTPKGEARCAISASNLRLLRDEHTHRPASPASIGESTIACLTTDDLAGMGATIDGTAMLRSVAGAAGGRRRVPVAVDDGGMPRDVSWQSGGGFGAPASIASRHLEASRGGSELGRTDSAAPSTEDGFGTQTVL